MIGLRMAGGACTPLGQKLSVLLPTPSKGYWEGTRIWLLTPESHQTSRLEETRLPTRCLEFEYS